MFGGILFAVVILILGTILKSPFFKGKFGEATTNFSFGLLLDEDIYHLIRNVTLPTKNGSTQIDHIIVSIYGIFVVETKNMKGWIFGSPGQKTWTQKIYKHSTKFQNPLRQNYKHVKAIQSLLGLNDRQVHSIVVFTGDETFKTEMPENVISGSGKCAKYIMSKTEEVLTESHVASIIAVATISPTRRLCMERISSISFLTCNLYQVFNDSNFFRS